jgi:hypothetical protein
VAAVAISTAAARAATAAAPPPSKSNRDEWAAKLNRLEKKERTGQPPPPWPTGSLATRYSHQHSRKRSHHHSPRNLTSNLTITLTAMHLITNSATAALMAPQQRSHQHTQVGC